MKGGMLLEHVLQNNYNLLIINFVLDYANYLLIINFVIDYAMIIIVIVIFAIHIFNDQF